MYFRLFKKLKRVLLSNNYTIMKVSLQFVFLITDQFNKLLFSLKHAVEESVQVSLESMVV